VGGSPEKDHFVDTTKGQHSNSNTAFIIIDSRQPSKSTVEAQRQSTNQQHID
jgi:hypothetical protein